MAAEAAHALGMSRGQTLRHVLLPQALRMALPAMTNDFVALLKDSSLVSVITVVELTKQMTITAVDVRGWLVPGTNWLAMGKQNVNGVCFFSAAPTPTRKNDETLVLALTPSGNNVLVTVRVLDRDNAEAVICETSALDTPAADRAQLDPEVYWQACIKTVREVLQKSGVKPDEVKAVGVSSQGETTITLDAQGKAIYPALVWLDYRASKQSDFLSGRGPKGKGKGVLGVPEAGDKPLVYSRSWRRAGRFRVCRWPWVSRS